MFSLTIILLLNLAPKESASVAMILEVSGEVMVIRGSEKPIAKSTDLLRSGDKVKVPSDGKAYILIIKDLHVEVIRDNTTVTIGDEGCTPVDAIVLRIRSKLTERKKQELQNDIREGRLGGVIIALREGDQDRPEVTIAPPRSSKPRMGMRIDQLSENSAAHKAMLNIGDIIIAVRDIQTESFEQPETFEELRRVLASARGKIEITILRGEDRKQVRVQLTPDEGIIGVGVTPFNLERSTPRTTGQQIDVIDEDGPAQKAGLRVGDIIIKVGAAQTQTFEELQKALGSAEGKIAIMVLRGKSPVHTTVNPIAGKIGVAVVPAYLLSPSNLP